MLTHLYLGDNLIHEKGCRCIGDALKENRSLKVLDLHLNRIDDKGGHWFCQALAEKDGNRVLEEINFRGNSLGSNFTLAMAQLLLDTSLRKIDISCNQIKKKDATALHTSLEQNPNIIFLDIRNNEIND